MNEGRAAKGITAGGERNGSITQAGSKGHSVDVLGWADPRGKLRKKAKTKKAAVRVPRRARTRYRGVRGMTREMTGQTHCRGTIRLGALSHAADGRDSLPCLK
jgi:hypothetical protein